MRQFMVNAVTLEVQEAHWTFGVSTVKSVSLAVFAAVGLVLAGTPSFAGSRPASSNQYYYTPATTKSASATYVSSTPVQSGQYERKCMTLSCGSTWCYNVRR